MMRGHDLGGMFVDPGVSGSIPIRQRPAGRELLAVLKPGDTVIAAKLDRLFRSSSDALNTAQELKEQGVSLIISDMGPDPVTENGVSKLFFTMLAAFAEFERTRIAERVAEGRKAKAAAGGATGGEPKYGWRVVGQGRDARLAVHEGEQEVMRVVRRCKQAGMGLRETGRYLTMQGHLSRRGKPFSHEQVNRMLTAGGAM